MTTNLKRLSSSNSLPVSCVVKNVPEPNGDGTCLAAADSILTVLFVEDADAVRFEDSYGRSFVERADFRACDFQLRFPNNANAQRTDSELSGTPPSTTCLSEAEECVPSSGEREDVLRPETSSGESVSSDSVLCGIESSPLDRKDVAIACGQEVPLVSESTCEWRSLLSVVGLIKQQARDWKLPIYVRACLSDDWQGLETHFGQSSLLCPQLKIVECLHERSVVCWTDGARGGLLRIPVDEAEDVAVEVVPDSEGRMREALVTIAESMGSKAGVNKSSVDFKPFSLTAFAYAARNGENTDVFTTNGQSAEDQSLTYINSNQEDRPAATVCPEDDLGTAWSEGHENHAPTGVRFGPAQVMCRSQSEPEVETEKLEMESPQHKKMPLRRTDRSSVMERHADYYGGSPRRDPERKTFGNAANAPAHRPLQATRSYSSAANESGQVDGSSRRSRDVVIHEEVYFGQTANIKPITVLASFSDPNGLVFWRERCEHLEAQLGEERRRLAETTRACEELREQLAMARKRQMRRSGGTPSGSSSVDVCDLSTEQVSKVMHAYGLGQYVAKFKAEGINGQLLTQLDESMLENDLQVKNRIHRDKILQLSRGNRDRTGQTHC